jgi:hypothetical protein
MKGYRMGRINEWDIEHPLNLDKAFKGGGAPAAPAKSQAQIDAEKAQEQELADLKAKEESRTAAMARKRRGRASLLTGDETGMKQTLGGE